jgi:hypothetical protein
VGVGRANEEGEGVKIWWIHFVFMYENISIKFVEFLRSGKGE